MVGFLTVLASNFLLFILICSLLLYIVLNLMVSPFLVETLTLMTD